MVTSTSVTWNSPKTLTSATSDWTPSSYDLGSFDDFGGMDGYDVGGYDVGGSDFGDGGGFGGSFGDNDFGDFGGGGDFDF